MSIKFNLITLSMLAATGNVSGADFSVNNANTSSVNMEKYQCQRCERQVGLTGSVSVISGWNNGRDIHAGNAFGRDDNGIGSAVSSELHYQSTAGYRVGILSHNLGFDNGSFQLEAARNGIFSFSADYRLLTRDDVSAFSAVRYRDGLLDSGDFAPKLYTQREKIGTSLELYYQDYLAFLAVSHEHKSGNKASSLIETSGKISDGVLNFAEPIDSRTDALSAGVGATGNNWFARIQYAGSFYRNDIENISTIDYSNVYSATPDNDAHQVAFDGQYLWGRTVVNGHLAAGRLIQDDDLLQLGDTPLLNWNGEVVTRDARISLSSLLAPKWRVNGVISYSDRDNQGAIAEFPQWEWDNIYGAFRANLPLDITRKGLKLQSSYRVNRRWHFSGQYQYKQTERNYLERERNREDNLWLKLDVKPSEIIKLGIKGFYETRDGSQYDASRITAPNENPLLRKYNLADRQRVGAEVSFHHTPRSWLSLDITLRYAKDDYSDTEIGLTAAEDYRYDSNLSIDPNDALHFYAAASQQWINSDIAGSANYASADWFGRIDDRFINLGAGFQYRLSQSISIGGDYLFANSESNAAIDSHDYGDYYDYSHSLELYSHCALTDSIGIKLSYHYQRYYDTDDAQVAVDAISRLTTLGKLEHNYNAQMLMLSFSYKLP